MKDIIRRILNFILNWMNLLFLERVGKAFCYRRNFRRGYRSYKRGDDNVIECLGWYPDLLVLMNGKHNRLHVGSGCFIMKHCTIQIEGEGLEVRIGDGVILMQCVNIVCQEQSCRIVIGDRCTIGHHVMFRSSDSHPIFDCQSGARLNLPRDIILDEHVWVAPRSTILKGVNIGMDSIVGTGSVVTRDVPAGSLAAGNPARVVKGNVRWRLAPAFETMDNELPYRCLMDEES